MACYLPGSSISEFRIVLVGKAGSGKSASGNTILGRTEFRSAVSTSAVTKVCEKRAGVSNGRRVTVVDTPGLFNRELSEEDLKREIVRCISLSAPGPHAFLLVLQVGRFTQQERETVGLIQKLFGDGAARYIILLFTRGDDLDDTTIEEYIQRSSEGLREIAEKCGNRYHVFNNRNSNQSQVTGLLEKIESMVAANGESCYTREMYQEAESAMRQEQERMRSEREEEKRREEEEQRRKFLGEQKGTGILASGEPSPLPLNDAKEKCEEEMKKQPAPRRSGRRGKVKDERPNTKEKCEEEMKKQPEPRRSGRRGKVKDERPNMSGCEANAEEETGETEEQEPVSGSEVASLEETQRETSSPEQVRLTLSEFRIVLVGKTGAGKSAAGNTILGRREFRSEVGTGSVTKECEKKKGVVAGRDIAVVDTPGFFDTELSSEKVKSENVQCIPISSPGPHVFLLVIPVGRFTKEEKEAVDKIEEIFGEGAAKYTMVLFSRGDDLIDKTIEEYIQEASREHNQLLEKCGNRYHVFNNRNMNDRTQVTELLEKIEAMVAENGGTCYTNEMYRELEAKIREMEQRLKQQYDEELHRKEEELRAKFQKEIDELKEKTEEKFEKLDEEMKRRDERIKDMEEKHLREREELKRFYKEKHRNARGEAEKSIDMYGYATGWLSRFFTFKL